MGLKSTYINIPILAYLFILHMSCPPFTTLQWNARGITHKIDDILDSVKHKTPDFLIFQETNLLKNANFELKGYTIFRFGEKKIGRGTGKGILTAVKEPHYGWVTKKIDNEQAQILNLEVYINNRHKINISNIYRKTSKYSREEGEQFVSLLDKHLTNHILAGDFNAHHTLWHDPQCDGVG